MKFIHFLAIFLLFACKEDDLDFAFRMEYINQRFEIPAGINPIESHFFLQADIPSNKATFFGNFSEEDITEVSPLGARLTSLEGTNINYGFISEVSIRICTDEIFSQQDIVQKCAREIFFREDIPLNTGDEIDLLPNGLNVKEFLTRDDFSVVVVLRRLRDFPPTSINTRLDMEFQARQ